MEEDTQRVPVLPRFTRSTKKREQGTLQKWVQCTRCKKWRRVPFQLKDVDLGENWECKDNAWDSQFSSCSVPQALSDEQIDAILDACQQASDDDMGEEGGEDRGFQDDGGVKPLVALCRMPVSRSFDTGMGEDAEEMPFMSEAPRTFTRRFRTTPPPPNAPRTSSRLRARVASHLPDSEPHSATSSRGRSVGRPKEFGRNPNGRGRGGYRGSVSRGRSERRGGRGGRGRMGSNDITDIAEALLGMGANDGGFHASQVHDVDMQSEAAPGSWLNSKGGFPPGRVVWAKVDGHDWWPARVVRRRSVPSEVGPPPGGVNEVMSYTPVVFFTPKGIPKEVELGMESVEFPIAMCRRACGEVDEDEAEYAWLSQDKIRPFLQGQYTGRHDGVVSDDIVLKSSAEAAHRAIANANRARGVWSADEEDSEGGWGHAAESNSHKSRSSKKKHGKSKGSHKRKMKMEDDGSEADSMGEGGPEMLSYGSWLLQPKIAVEHLHAWRHPLSPEERLRDRDNEKRANRRRLKQLAALQRAIEHGMHPTECLTCVVDVPQETVDSDEEPARISMPDQALDAIGGLGGETLRQEEREAVSTLLGFSENPPMILPRDLGASASYNEPEYFVKYANRSHMHNEWVNESTLAKIAKRKLINFKRRYGDEPVNMFVPEWAEPERLVARRKCRTGPGWELLVKWKDLGYDQCTWEVENYRILAKPEAVALYLALWDRQRRAFYRNTPRAQQLSQELRIAAERDFSMIEGQPVWVHGSQLLAHQIDSLNWFRSRWLARKGGILLGEDGLGKTACVISFMQSLREEFMCAGPILVVVPNGQLERWEGEVAFWGGRSMDSVTHQGSAAARSNIWDYEIWQVWECADGNIPCREGGKIPRAEVVLTSYENMTSDFAEVPWSLIVLDSRGGAKGSVSRMGNMLKRMEAMHLVVATHLPSSQRELTSMHEFLNPHADPGNGTKGDTAKNDVDENGSHDSSVDEEKLISHLEHQLEQHVFRVERPPPDVPLARCREVLLPFRFTPRQTEYFRKTLAKHYEVLTDQSIPRHSSHNVGAFRRIVQDLCQVCHHPFLLEPESEDAPSLDSLLEASGKLRLLDQLLDCLKGKGVKVMILTQTSKTSELLSRYLTLRFSPRGFEGVFPGDSTLAQHQAVQSFSTPNYPGFVFLATPETCGLGTCLPSVNLVVIFNSSPDPNQDLLAFVRARQIGTRSELPVIRLFAAGSVEERVSQLADRRENGLDAVLGTSHSRGTAADSKLLEDILVYGAKIAFPSSGAGLPVDNRENGDLNEKEGIASLPGSKSMLKMESEKPYLTVDAIDQLVDTVLYGFGRNSTEKSGTLGPRLEHVKWRIREMRSAGNGMEMGVSPVIEDTDINVGVEGVGCCAFWEALVKETWIRLKREELKNREKLRPVVDVSDHEFDSGEGVDHDETAARVEEGRTVKGRGRGGGGRGLGRRKRGEDYGEMDADEPVAAKKKRKSQRPLTDIVDQGHRDFMHWRNGMEKWSRDALLSSKAQQDVLMRVISDPATLEGQAAQRAFARIDQIASDLSLPTNIVLIARQIAEVLLTMREETDQGAYFQDYTLVVLVAFAAHLGSADLGENHGLQGLAQKYGHDLPAMEQVFHHITRMMHEYKETMLKIKEMDSESNRNRNHNDDVMYGNGGGIQSSAVAAPTAREIHSLSGSDRKVDKDRDGLFLHKELDGFLQRLPEVMELDHRPQVEFPQEALGEPPGAPIKGQTPSYQWYLGNSQPTTPEMCELFRQARACDVEMYIIEKAHTLRTNAIEKVVLDFQEKVREYGIRALDDVKRSTLQLSQQVTARQTGIRNSLNNLSAQAPPTGNQMAGQQPTYLQILRALQAHPLLSQQHQREGAMRNVANSQTTSSGAMPLASSCLTPSLHDAGPVRQPKLSNQAQDSILTPGPASAPLSTVNMRPVAPPQHPPDIANSASQSQQNSLENVQLLHKGGNHSVVLHPGGAAQQNRSQQWRAFASAGQPNVNSSQQSVKALERLLLAHLNPHQVPPQERSHPGCVIQYAVPQSSQHMPSQHLNRAQSFNNRQVLMQHLQQPHVQRLVQEGNNQGGPGSKRQLHLQRQPASPPLNPQLPAVGSAGPGMVGIAKSSQPGASSVGGNSVQIPASFGAALNSLLPYTNVRVISHNNAPRSGAPSSQPAQLETTSGSGLQSLPMRGERYHQNPQVTPLSFVHGTARVIQEKPPSIRLEPAQPARVVLSHPMSGMNRSPAPSPPDTHKSNEKEAAAPANAKGFSAVGTPITSTISTGDNPVRPQSPGLPSSGSIGATITTGSGPAGVVLLDPRGEGSIGQTGPVSGSGRAPLLPGNGISSKVMSLVTTGDEQNSGLSQQGGGGDGGGSGGGGGFLHGAGYSPPAALNPSSSGFDIPPTLAPSQSFTGSTAEIGRVGAPTQNESNPSTMEKHTRVGPQGGLNGGGGVTGVGPNLNPFPVAPERGVLPSSIDDLTAFRPFHARAREHGLQMSGVPASSGNVLEEARQVLEGGELPRIENVVSAGPGFRKPMPNTVVVREGGNESAEDRGKTNPRDNIVTSLSGMRRD
ncbi:hypothetical protein BSKO_07675 [Bryopsis sp. KO-2023]|nr:hypothetical protein BSKO_07675 [Bryopsis sp. KO-2023]